ncbi:transcription factor E4F1-like [Ochlerotatus camptorhynchus]|uniref:transcription factor E4F1-like n=1 Tax=Ochlerotatus camptorhynchus TaxID=644619 RepID=UPI0031D2FBC7
MYLNGVLALENLQLPSAKSPTEYCRLCLARDNLVLMSSFGECIHPSDDETSATQAVQLIELIFECTDVRLSPEHEPACAVCQHCKRSLVEFYRFRARAKRVDELIKSRQLEETNQATIETDKTDLEQQQQQQPETNQLALLIEPSSLVESKPPINNGAGVGGDGVDEISTINHKIPPSAESRKRQSGVFLAVGVKRPRPKLPTPVIIASISVAGGGKYRCRYCPKSFKTALGLTEHSRNHNRPHQCPNCMEQFQHAPSLARHIRNRTCFTFTKYRCRVCTESFLEQGDWAEHIKIHADDFPYQCHVNTVHLLQY